MVGAEPDKNSADLFKLKREFLEYCELEKGQSLLTINSYSRYLDKFLQFLSDHMTISQTKDSVALSLTPIDITQDTVREYRLYVNRLRDRYGRELKKTTQNYHILALRSFLRYLAFRGITTLSPEKVPVAKAGDREINFLEADEVKNIINVPISETEFGARDRAILATLFSTGLRVSELVALNVSDLNFDRGEIAVLGKGKKVRLVFLSPETIDVLREYLAERGLIAQELISLSEDALFLSNRGERLTVRSIERLVKKYAAMAGVTKKVSPHTLRHSFATDLLISGADIRSVQSMLGHASISTTQIYTHVTDQHLREIHQKYHGKSLVEEENKNTTE